MSPLETIIMTLGWVVGPRYENNVKVGYKAVKGWNVINLDDEAEERVSVRATTPDELIASIMAFEAELERVHAEALAKNTPK